MGTQRFYISLATIIVYALLLPLAIFVTIRHGLLRFLGFLYLCIFCGLRIASASLGVASENNGHSNRDDLVWSEILGSVGIGPLLLVGMGLLSRVNINTNPGSPLRIRALQALHIPNIIALILAIVGGVRLSSSTPTTQNSGKTFAQAGIAIFMAVFSIYVILALFTWVNTSSSSSSPHRSIARGEKTILYGILLASPFLFIRILYAMLAVYRDTGRFKILDGSIMAQLGMGIIEEMIIVLLYVGVGVLAPVEAEHTHPRRKGEWDEGKRLSAREEKTRSVVEKRMSYIEEGEGKGKEGEKEGGEGRGIEGKGHGEAKGRSMGGSE